MIDPEGIGPGSALDVASVRAAEIGQYGQNSAQAWAAVTLDWSTVERLPATGVYGHAPTSDPPLSNPRLSG